MNLEERIQIEEQVEVFINVLTRRWGIKEDEIPQLIDNIRWLDRSRSGISRITWHASLSLVGLAIIGFGAMLWEGLKTLVKGS